MAVRLRVFAGPGVEGVPVTVAFDDASADAPCVAVVGPPGEDGVAALAAAGPDGPAPTPPEAALAAAEALEADALALYAPEGAFDTRRDGDARWTTLPAAEVLGYVQPAFAARALNLAPLDLDARWMPQGATAGAPVLVVPVEPAALDAAVFDAGRLRGLVLRQRFDAALAVALDAPRARARLLADGRAPAVGLALGALAAWTAAHRLGELCVRGEGWEARVGGQGGAEVGGRVVR